MTLACGKGAPGFAAAGNAALAAGRYTLAVALTVDNRPTTIPLGELDVAADGLQTRAP